MQTRWGIAIVGGGYEEGAGDMSGKLVVVSGWVVVLCLAGEGRRAPATWGRPTSSLISANSWLGPPPRWEVGAHPTSDDQADGF